MMTNPHQEQEAPEQIVSALRDGLGNRLVAVVLFGSRARGEASDSSDWDMLIIVESLPRRIFERRKTLLQSLPPRYRGAISMLAKTPEEFGFIGNCRDRRHDRASVLPHTVDRSLENAHIRRRTSVRHGNSQRAGI
jgi:predicted nucleotidyltransferase